MSDSVEPHRWQLTRLPVPGILQARTPEWVAISFSNAGKRKVKVKLLSRVPLLATQWTAAYQAPLSMGFSRQQYWSGVPLPSLSLYAYHTLYIHSLPLDNTGLNSTGSLIHIFFFFSKHILQNYTVCGWLNPLILVIVFGLQGDPTSPL